MENRAKIITDLDRMFGSQIEHEIIKMILQSCNWNRNTAVQMLNDMTASSSTNISQEQASNGWYQVTPSRGRKKKPKVSGEFKNNTKDRTKLLILMRGLPGSGKSTLAQELVNTGIINSTDDFFYYRGNYKFNPYQLEEAHDWNKKRSAQCMRDNISPIIIDNTNIEIWEMRPYVILALQYDYKVKIMEPNTPWKFKPYDLSQKNRHGISKWKIEDMLSRYDRNITLKSILPTEYRKVECPEVNEPQKTIHKTNIHSNGSNFCHSKVKGPPNYSNNIKLETDPKKSSHNMPISAQNNWARTAPIGICSANNSLSIPNSYSESDTLLPSWSKTSHSLNELKHPPDKSISSIDAWSQGVTIISSPETKQRTNIVRRGDPNKWLNDAKEFDKAEAFPAELNEGQPKKQYNDKETQTLLVDDNIDSCRVLYGQADRFIPVKGVPETLYNRGITKIDAGCMTEELCHSISNIKAIEQLSLAFPSCSREALADVLEKGNYDIDWIVNILIDSGYKMSSSFDADIITEDLSCTLTRNDKNEENSIPIMFPTDDGNIKDETIFEDISINYDKVSKPSTNESTKLSAIYSPQVKVDSDMIEISLDEDSAKNLIKVFGPIGSIQSGTTISKEKGAIILPIELCKDMHKYWAKTYHSNFSIDNIVECDPSFKKEIQHNQISCKGLSIATNNTSSVEDNLDPFVLEPPKSFKEIMDVEEAVENSLNDRSNGVHKLSSILSLQKLEKEFSHVDPSAVKVNFNECLLNYDQAKLQLTFIYGQKCNELQKSSLPVDSKPQYEEKIDVSKSSQDYREDAMNHIRRKSEAIKAAHNYTQRKMYSTSSHYSQIAAYHSTLAREANDNAASQVMQNSRHNSMGTNNTLDVHFLRVDEAIKFLQAFISSKKKYLTEHNLKEVKVSVITGYGSCGEQPKLKPAIVKFCTSLGYTFYEEPGNPGMLRLIIRL